MQKRAPRNMDLLLSLISLLLVAGGGGRLANFAVAAAAAATPNSQTPAAYWQKELPRTSMPPAIRDLLAQPNGAENTHHTKIHSAQSSKEPIFINGPRKLGKRFDRGRKQYSQHSDDEKKVTFLYGPRDEQNQKKVTLSYKPQNEQDQKRIAFSYKQPHDEENQKNVTFSYKPQNEEDQKRATFSYKPQDEGDQKMVTFSYKPQDEGDQKRVTFSYKPPHDEENQKKATFSYKPNNEEDQKRVTFSYKPQDEGDQKRVTFSYKPQDEGDQKPFSYKPQDEGDQKRVTFSYKPPHDEENQKVTFSYKPQNEEDQKRVTFSCKPQDEGDQKRVIFSYKPQDKGESYKQPHDEENQKKATFSYKPNNEEDQKRATFSYKPQDKGEGNEYADKHSHGIQRLADVFFLEDALRLGSVMMPTIPRTTSLPTLLRRGVANSIPFSTDRFADIVAMFAPVSLPIADEIRWVLEKCENPRPLTGEKASCATSMEDLVEVPMSLLGTRHVRAFSADMPVEAASEEPRGRYSVTTIRVISDSSEMVTCHDMTYPYAVFYCHTASSATRAYLVTLVSEDGAAAPPRMEAVAVCHHDTSRWSPEHPFLQVLHAKPGDVAACHFLPKSSIVWVPTGGQGEDHAAQ